jgi:hypothetical protein
MIKFDKSGEKSNHPVSYFILSGFHSFRTEIVKELNEEI